MIARVLIDGPSELVFDYAVPAGLDVRPGCRVRVPLRRKSATGTVLSTSGEAPADFALRELESLIDPFSRCWPTRRTCVWRWQISSMARRRRSRAWNRPACCGWWPRKCAAIRKPMAWTRWSSPSRSP